MEDGREIFDDDLTADPEEETSGTLPQNLHLQNVHKEPSFPYHRIQKDKKETFYIDL